MFQTDKLVSNSLSFSLSFKIESGNNNYIQIQDENSGSYLISYLPGDTPPDDCSNNPITAVGTSQVLIPSLVSGEKYSFRVCKSNGLTKTLSLTAGNLSVTNAHSGTELWNIWLKKSDASQACDITANYLDECFHGSEVKHVVANNFDSCENLELEDSYGFFNWSCEIVDDKAVFTSNLKPETLIRDMITSTDFKTNFVSLKHNNKLVNVSAEDLWWNNDFFQISGALAYTGTLDNAVYVVPEAEDFQQTISISGSNSVLVTLSGAEISGTTTTTNSITLENGSLFNWIEVNMQSDGTADGIRLGGNLHYVRHSTLAGANDDCVFIPGSSQRKMLIEHSTISDCNYGIFLSGSDNNIVRDTLLHDHTVSGMELNDSNDNKFINLKFLRSGEGYRFVGTASYRNYISNNTIADSDVGINLGTGGDNVFYNVKIYNSYQDGLYVEANQSGNRFINVYTVGGRENGLNIDTASGGLKFINLVSAFNRESGLRVSDSSQIDFVNVSSFRNANLAGTGGFLFSFTDKISCTNCLSTLNNNFGFIIGESGLDSTNNRFHGNFIVSNNGGEECEVVTPPNTSHGIADSTCTVSGTDNSTDFTDVNSTARFYSNIDLSNSFVGVVDTDSVNEHGEALPLDVDSINDWFEFENLKRFWVNEGASLAINTNNTICNTGSNCYIWDMNLIESSSNPLFNSSYNFTDKNPEGLGGFCPAAVATLNYVDSQAVETNSTGNINAIEINGDAIGNDNGLCEVGENCFSRYLKHAYEMVDDNIGDNDGLCEANEACIYTANWADAQTPSELTTCTFEPSSGLQNIQMYIPQ